MGWGVGLSNTLALSFSLIAKRLTEDYYASLVWLFKLVRRTQNSRHGTNFASKVVSAATVLCATVTEFGPAHLGPMGWVSQIYTVHGSVRIGRLHSVTIKPKYFHTNELHFHSSANHKAYTLVLICGCIMPWCSIIKISA